MKLIDVVNSSESVSNVFPDVSEGRVFFGRLEWMPDYALETVCCRIHGAMNKVSKDGLWRCLECSVSAKEGEVVR